MRRARGKTYEVQSWIGTILDMLGPAHIDFRSLLRGIIMLKTKLLLLLVASCGRKRKAESTSRTRALPSFIATIAPKKKSSLYSEGESMDRRNPKVDAVLRQEKKWREEFETLRTLVLDCQLTEDLKWYQPCYMLHGKNVVLIHGFKEYSALMFFKGALLKDPKRILSTPGQHQSARQIRFTNAREIIAMGPILKAYIREAIEVEKAGLKVKLKKTADFKIPEEFQKMLDELPALKAAFYALTPGRQRNYIFYFSQPKQSKTREARVKKCMELICGGKGLSD